MTAARPDTWMPMFWGDYARDTGHLNAAGHGAYLMLIKHYWCTGKPLNDDDDELWRIACCDSKKEWQKLRPKIVRLFQAEGGELRHKRVETELSRAAANVAKRADAGRLGAASKWSGANVDSGASATRSERLSEARRKGTHSAPEWDALVAVFGGRCVRCGIAPDAVCKDHITPIYLGGSDALENLQPLCRTCNSSKGPESVDHRVSARSDWRQAVEERLASAEKAPGKRLANAWQTPGTSSSPSAVKSSEAKASAGKPAPAVREFASSESEVFRVGKEVLGANAGGMITRLRKAQHFDDRAALDLIEQARAKDDPREWLGAVLRGDATAATPDHILFPPEAYRNVL